MATRPPLPVGPTGHPRPAVRRVPLPGRDRSPGVWRTSPITVTDSDGALAYQQPRVRTQVPALMAEVVDWLEHERPRLPRRGARRRWHTSTSVSVHPFRGWEREDLADRAVPRVGTRRAPSPPRVQLDRGTPRPHHHGLLQRPPKGPGRTAIRQPERVRNAMGSKFCITAHIEQARIRIDQVTRAALPLERTQQPSPRDATGPTVSSSQWSGASSTGSTAPYAAEARGSPWPQRATDIRRLVDAPRPYSCGPRTRNARYLASDALRRQIAKATSHSRPVPDAGL